MYTCTNFNAKHCEKGVFSSIDNIKILTQFDKKTSIMKYVKATVMLIIKEKKNLKRNKAKEKKALLKSNYVKDEKDVLYEMCKHRRKNNFLLYGIKENEDETFLGRQKDCLSM